ncbi:hypothetical protein [Sporosarcina sp. 6E9]|uniref:hypothetical protein n=1 Tax=Sporosarcina sp. 6E9 TaxID=2819235 RepID=UPI001B30F99B|nr:hypothetical protein [Sporosarcina sp. 6E9]
MKTNQEKVHETKPCTCPPCNHEGCRKELCDTNFSVRLGGLDDSLTYRMYGLIWNEVMVELVNGNKIQGTLNFVGFNFVEIIMGGPRHVRLHEKGQSLIILDKDIHKIELV